MKYQRIFSVIVLSIFFIFTDQMAKYIIRFSGGFYICNKGIAFGIIFPHWLIYIFILSAVCFGMWLIFNFQVSSLANNFLIFNKVFNSKNRTSIYALILIFSGAISNLIDRLCYGCVIDFIDLKIWPVFNLADIFICLGGFLLIFNLTNSSKKS